MPLLSASSNYIPVAFAFVVVVVFASPMASAFQLRNVLGRSGNLLLIRNGARAMISSVSSSSSSSSVTTTSTTTESFVMVAAAMSPLASGGGGGGVGGGWGLGHHRRRRRCRRGVTTAVRMATTTTTTSDAPFDTWTFDKPCEVMDWTELPVPTMFVVNDDTDDDDDSDLVILGIFGPASSEEDVDDKTKKSQESSPPPPPPLEGTAGKINELLGGALTDLMVENAKAMKHGSASGVMSPTLRMVTKGSDGISKTKRYVLLGLGSEDKLMEEETAMKLGAEIASRCHSENKITSCAVHLPLPSSSLEETSSSLFLSNLSSSFYSALYTDNRYRTGDKIQTPAEDLSGGVKLVVPSSATTTGGGDAAAVTVGRGLAQGLFLTKDIVNAPHNILNSVSLANTAKKIAEESNGSMTCKVLDKAECEKRGMGAYLGVARGSETEPQFIHLTYKPEGEIKSKVGIVGKGLLFDTGGYNIKTAMMELMKFDCGGAAAVLGAARAVAALRPAGVEAHFVVAACENMINERAVVPSDVLTASNGKTIEVLNTDAEGRLTLADAIVYADQELACESIIELSTLTGACMVSLGTAVCGLWTENDELAAELADISKDTGDKSWRMPMEKSYNKQLESKIADIANIGGKYGGAITAALFLQNFVEGKKPFAHIDIAGPVWHPEKGATGFGTKMVTEWVKRQGQK